MAMSFEECLSILKAHLTPGELGSGVVYAAEVAIPAGEPLQFPGTAIDVPWPAHLAFVDREPLANWAHSCRYVLIHLETGEIVSHEARLPPFPAGRDYQWGVAYKAEGVPDGALLVVS
jgi:hypothetical protein